MSQKEYQGVWVFCEHRNGQLSSVTLELLSKGRLLADILTTDLVAVILGFQITGCQEQVFEFGVDRVYIADDPQLEFYQSDAYVPVLHRLVEQHRPEMLILASTDIGLDLAPCLAARLNTGLSAHCIDLEVDEIGHLVQIIPAFGMASVVKILCPDHYPQMATVKPGSFQIIKRQSTRRDVIRTTIGVREDQVRITIIEDGILLNNEATDLKSAEVVVVGGAGICSREGWDLLEQLAGELGASIGATRPTVDEGWAHLSQMIGHSGKSVQPKLYIGVGVSGDMLHMIGMKNAGIAVAINIDPHAPVFQQVDFGLVGDYRKILPLLIHALHETRKIG